MTNPTAWAHLPNAKHIDRILADVKARPDVWTAALDAARDAARDAALDAARDAALDTARVAARNAAWDAAWAAVRVAAWDDAALDAALGVAWDAIYALIAWDEAATLLILTPDALRILGHTAPESMNHQAILLLPAVIALNTKGK